MSRYKLKTGFVLLLWHFLNWSGFVTVLSRSLSSVISSLLFTSVVAYIHVQYVHVHSPKVEQLLFCVVNFHRVDYCHKQNRIQPYSTSVYRHSNEEWRQRREKLLRRSWCWRSTAVSTRNAPSSVSRCCNTVNITIIGKYFRMKCSQSSMQELVHVVPTWCFYL